MSVHSKTVLAGRAEHLFSTFPSFDRAACRGLPPEWWDVDHSESAIQRGKEICRGCPEQLECATFALEHKLRGVWGGILFGLHGPISRRSPNTNKEKAKENKKHAQPGPMG